MRTEVGLSSGHLRRVDATEEEEERRRKGRRRNICERIDERGETRARTRIITKK